MHRKHGIDRGTEVTEGSGAWGLGGYPGGVSGVPSSGKVTTYLQGSNTIVLPLIFGIWFDVFPIGTAYSTVVSHPTSRLWTVGRNTGIASVRAKSVYTILQPAVRRAFSSTVGKIISVTGTNPNPKP